MERKRRPRASAQVVRFQRVPSLENVSDLSFQSSPSVDHYRERSRESPKIHRVQKELEPVEYAWLIKQEFALSLKYRKKWSLNRKSRLSKVGSDIWGEKISKKTHMDLSELQHLDLATGFGSSRHSLVDEVINEVLARALKTADLSRLQHIGVPPRYLPTIAEAMQAEHLSELKHLDLANNGSFGQKTLELRRLVETKLPTFLSCNILA